MREPEKSEPSDLRGVDRGVSHTPGPWKACNSATVTIEDEPTTTPSHVKRVFLDNQGRRNHQFIATCNMNVPEHSANAHLIAAAPDLLDVLKRFVEFPFAHQGVAEGSMATMLDQAREAITKATRRQP